LIHSQIIIGDYVFDDLNRNGIQDVDDAGIVDVVLSLYNGDQLIATTLSDNNGAYSFNNDEFPALQPNTTDQYSIEIELDQQPLRSSTDQRPFIVVQSPIDSDEELDSNGIVAQRQSTNIVRALVRFETPSTNQTIDFGFQQPIVNGATLGLSSL
jgi:hypothetical protein